LLFKQEKSFTFYRLPAHPPLARKTPAWPCFSDNVLVRQAWISYSNKVARGGPRLGGKGATSLDIGLLSRWVSILPASQSRTFVARRGSACQPITSRPRNPLDHLDGGGLAGAVGTEQAEANAFRDLERDIGNGDQVLIALPEIADFENGRRDLDQMLSCSDTG